MGHAFANAILDLEWDDDDSPVVASIDPVFWGRPWRERAENHHTDATFSSRNVKANKEKYGPCPLHVTSRRAKSATYVDRWVLKPKLIKHPTWEEDCPQSDRFVQARYALLHFPHVTEEMADKVAHQFAEMGWHNAVMRGVTEGEWLWRRSRWEAGFH